MAENILKITESDRTPLVDALLKKLDQCDEAIEHLHEVIKALKEQNQALKDEIAELKKSPRRPRMKANKKRHRRQRDDKQTEEDKRPGSVKRSKKDSMPIHETVVVTPENLPEGAKLKRRHNFDVQDLRIRAHNTRYVLEDWELPDGAITCAKMPENVARGHFGNELCAFVLDQHHQCQVTQGLLHEQLREFGIDISSGQVSDILTESHEDLHQEKSEILQAGLRVSAYVQTDDTGARHDGKNGYCTHIGNEYFGWFHSSTSKSRINFLEILSGAFGGAYVLDSNAFEYMEKEGLPKKPLNIFKISMKRQFLSAEEWQAHLRASHVVKKRHVRIATEAALLAGALAGGLNKHLIILSDDAGQFNVPMLIHALCWIHEERHIKNLLPTMDKNRIAQEKILDDFWTLYGRLKTYRAKPTLKLKAEIEAEFDSLFKIQTDYASLNLVLKNICKKKCELLVVLDQPLIPLHNNGSETDIREYVKRRKVSGGTRSISGQRSRDTFASIKKTCRKLGVSFYQFLKDRLSKLNRIEHLGILIEQAALKNSRLGPRIQMIGT